MDSSTYGQLKVFHAIAREGSISAAARRLEIAVPSASQALKLLEIKIGVPLFSRTTRQIQLTEAGQKLLQRTEDALVALQMAIDDVQGYGSTPSGLVRLTLSRFAYQLIVRPVMAVFCTRYPQVQLEISINDATINLVEAGFDLGIRFGDTLDEGMVARQIYPPFRLGLYASAGYLARHGTPKTPEDLTAHRLIAYRFGTSNRLSPLQLEHNGETLTVDMPNPLICNDIDAVRDAIVDGIGIGRLFEPNLQCLPERAQFIPVLKKYWQQYPAVYLYYLRHAQKARRVPVLVDFLLERLAGSKQV